MLLLLATLPLGASHPVSYQLEAEDFATRTGGATITDEAASGGAAWSTSAAASISTRWFAEHQGTYRILVVARGVPDAGVYPVMTVFTDDRAIGHFRVNGSYATYRMEDTVEFGNRTLRVYFSNAGGERALVVDSVLIEIAVHNDPLPIWQEAESFPTKTTGGTNTDSRASAGRAWNVWSNGRIGTTFSSAAPTTYRASIWARADLLPGDATPAMMALRVDGVVLHTFPVSNTALWAEYRWNFTVDAGPHSLDVMFTNDARTETGDRNLRVDAVKLLPIGTFAPEPVVTTRYEVESFSGLSGGRVYNDSTASGAKGWNQWSNGVASKTITLAQADTLEFMIRARGTVLNEVWPKMELRIDGVTQTTWDVQGGTYAIYSDTAALSAGSHTIGIAFVNDARTSTQDRNLLLDHLDVRVTNATPPPPPPADFEPRRLEAESFTNKNGGTVITDSAASGGKAWKQWTNGQLSTSLVLPSAQQIEFVVRGKGSVADGIWPLMSLRVDDSILGEWSVSSGYASFTVVRNVTAGEHLIAVGFTNDGRSDSGEDRNLVVDYVELRSRGNSTIQPPQPPPEKAAPPIPGRSQWPQSGYDVRGSHFNQYESVIGAANASKLRSVWTATSSRAVFTMPAVVDGVAYFGDTGGAVYAVNVTTGAQIWKRTDASGNIAIGGMAVADGRVFYGKSGGEVIARYASNGTIIWRVDPEPNPSAFIWASPLYHDGKIYIGVASGQEDESFGGVPDFRGSFLRLDARTGALDWRFYIVPQGYTGGAMWSTAALDPDAGLVYLGTGNAYTAPAHANTDAIIALNMSTGAMRWSTQGFAGDVWTANDPEGPDTDFAMPVMMWNTTSGDKVVGAGNKIGDFFALDFDTGAVLYRVHPHRSGQGFFGPGAHAYGRLYAALGGDKVVIAMEPDTGRVLWRAPVTAGFTGGVAVSNGAVFAATQDGSVWAFDAITGAQLWKGTVPVTDPITLGSVSIAEGTLFVPFAKESWSGGTGGVAAFRPAAS